MHSPLAPQTGRLDRYVRRSYLRTSQGASRLRISYSLEEALRLADLPGEEEGRVYCFRSVSLAGVPSSATRSVWMEQVQRALGNLAAQAVHGTDPRAFAAGAVYFNNLEEALETLLRNALRSLSAVEWARPEWFSASLLGIAPETSYGLQIPAILDRLGPPAIAPGAAAAILFAALEDADPAVLLSSIPTATLREWIRTLDGQKSSAGDALPAPLPQAMNSALQRAASQFGWKDPGTVWLAAQAVRCISPAAWFSGLAVKRAQATLRQMEAAQRAAPPQPAAFEKHAATARSLIFDDDREIDAQPMRASRMESAAPLPAKESALADLHPMAGNRNDPVHRSVPHEGSLQSARSARASDSVLMSAPLLGEATPSAGLYFLLNALRRLGIAAALDACPALAEAGFAVHLMRRLACHAGVADDDPILICLNLAQTEFSLPADALALLSKQRKAWPPGFASPSCNSFESEFLLRVWVLAVRRWCWRSAKLTLRPIVQRAGRVWLTRTDLDVTLPLDGADIRIRRIGLDIDPGWLPWLGEFGRVVRFHYRDREPEERAC